MERDCLPQGYRATFRKKLTLTLFRMGVFGVAHRWGRAFCPPLSKIRHTYATVIKLGSYTLPKKDPKNV